MENDNNIYKETVNTKEDHNTAQEDHNFRMTAPLMTIAYQCHQTETQSKLHRKT